MVDRRVVTPVDEMDPEVLSEDMNDLRSAAEGGDVQAMFKFGKALLQGKVRQGVKLIKWFQACELGPICIMLPCSIHLKSIHSVLC